MPSTHTCLHYHVVFSTKDREAWISAVWRKDLHAFLGGCVREHDAVALEVGGTADHTHLLLSLKATQCLASVVQDIKRGSSRWVHEIQRRAGFAWQEGYGAFTVSPSRTEGVRAYILNQVEHHSKKTFKDEYVGLLLDSGIEFDERYLW